MTPQYSFFRQEGLLKRINHEDILFLETTDNYTRIHVADGFHFVRISLKMALEQLKDRRFVQVHRSYAVAIDNIDIITKEFIVPISAPTVQIPFTRKYLPHLIEQIKILGPQFVPGDESDKDMEKT